jgi:hypothetical protein
MLSTEANPLQKALDEVMIEEKGVSGRDIIWRDLWRDYGITLDALTTLDKMENALRLVAGDDAKALVKAAFAKYQANLNITETR